MRQELEEKNKTGNWRHARLFEEVEVAAEMGFLYSDWFALAEHDRAVEVARRRVKAVMAAYDAMVEEDKAKMAERTRNPKARGGRH